MSERTLDLEHYQRRSQFDYFRRMAYPYAGLTVTMDITSLTARIREKRLPFYLTMLYAASHSANAIPEFRRRVRGDQIIEFEHCFPSYTLALESGSYCYCSADDQLPFPEYLRDAKHRQEEARKVTEIKTRENEEQLFFFSSIPWVSYTAIVQPVPTPADSNPRITWGKYFEAEDRLKMPVSVLVNHALMDGFHISRFFQELQQRFDGSDWLCTDVNE